MVGGLSAGRVRRLAGDGPAITIAVVLFGAPLLAMTLWPHAPLAAALMALSGLGEGVWSVVVTSLRQAVVPVAIRGRVLATLRLFSWGTLSVGATLAGVLGQTIGVHLSAAVGCGAIVVVGPALAPFLRTDAIMGLRAANVPDQPVTGAPDG